MNHRSHTYFVWNGSYNRPGNIVHSLNLFGALMKYADMKLTVSLRKEKSEHQHFPQFPIAEELLLIARDLLRA